MSCFTTLGNLNYLGYWCTCIFHFNYRTNLHVFHWKTVNQDAGSWKVMCANRYAPYIIFIGHFMVTADRDFPFAHEHFRRNGNIRYIATLRVYLRTWTSTRANLHKRIARSLCAQFEETRIPAIAKCHYQYASRSVSINKFARSKNNKRLRNFFSSFFFTEKKLSMLLLWKIIIGDR